ncbi:MAG: LytR C-terminal domain-containing protein [Patescibacteria group bacterium]
MPPAKKSSARQVTFRPEPKKSGRPFLILLLIIAMAVSAAYLAIKGSGQPTEQPVTTQQQVAEQPGSNQVVSGNTLDRVKKHLYIPDGDQPRYIGTISDISLLRSKNPDFYANASEGDKVLIWNDRAVIYSESKDLIIAVATAKPLLQDEKPSQTASSTALNAQDADLSAQLASTTVEIRNATRVNGAASRLKLTLSKQAVNVVKVGDSSLPYTGTIIIDQTAGTSPAVASLIAQATSGTVRTDFPQGETPSQAGILIILGK